MAKIKAVISTKKKKKKGKKPKAMEFVETAAVVDMLKLFPVLPDPNNVPHDQDKVLTGWGFMFHVGMKLSLRVTVLLNGIPGASVDIPVLPADIVPQTSGAFIFSVKILDRDLNSNTTYICVISAVPPNAHTPDAIQIHTKV